VAESDRLEPRATPVLDARPSGYAQVLVLALRGGGRGKSDERHLTIYGRDGLAVRFERPSGPSLRARTIVGVTEADQQRDPTAPAAERRAEVAGLPVVWQEAPSSDRASWAPVLFLHGKPTDGDDFLSLLARTGGIAPDLPGFGRSAKPADFSYSIDGYADFLAAFVDHLGLDRFSLVVHDWGGVGLALAQRRPAAIERLVVIDSVPLLPGYRWHRWARVWRTPVLGELAMGFSTRFILRRALRAAFVTPDPHVDALADRAWSRFDHGTQRAILKLYRSAPPEVLARAGVRLGEIAAPALVVWGEQDPYLPTDFAHAYAEALGGPTRVRTVPDAGHWPWLERPELADEIASFLREG
jgi:pimeloyl-ACP methyl ester carboxylesterase